MLTQVLFGKNHEGTIKPPICFLVGMEESELVEASKGIAQLQMDYREIGQNSGTLNPPQQQELSEDTEQEHTIQHPPVPPGDPCPCPP